MILRMVFDLLDIARVAYEAHRAFLIVSQGDKPLNSWDGVDSKTRELIVRMVSSILAQPHMTPEQVHETWSDRRIWEGWKKGARNYEARTSPNLVPWDDLSEAQQLQNKLFLAVVLALAPDVTALAPDRILESEG